MSVFSVLVMLFSSIPLNSLLYSPSHVHTLNGPVANETTPYLPYLTNVTSWPLPDALPNETGSFLLPQFATLKIGQSSAMALAYVRIDSSGNHIVEFRTGSYNASMAQAIGLYGCTNNCANHVPLEWSAPVAVATYGLAPIQQIALATGDSLGINVAIAVASNNSTELYVSMQEGSAGSWASLTGSAPAFGDHPQIAMNGGCSLYLTTLDPNGTRVSLFTIGNLCQGPGVPSSGGLQMPSGGGRGPLLPTSPPTVAEVVPQQATAGTHVVINGSGFSNVHQVLFGGAAAYYTISSPSSISAIVPAGAGVSNVTVWNPGGWSAVNCSDEFYYGPTVATTAPQLEWVSPSSASAGATVYIGGVNLGIVSQVEFGLTPAAFHVISSTEISATVPSGSGATNVTVTSSGGTSLDTCATRFAYPLPMEPVVNSISPIEGPSGTSVTVTGADFDSNATVSFGSELASSVTYSNPNLLSATSPAGSATVPVRVSQWGFESPESCADLYTYGATTGPQVTGLSPSSGWGNSSVTIAGTNLGSSSTVYVGGVATGTVSSTGQSVKVPQGVGNVQVQVSGTGGISPPSCADRYEILGPSLIQLPGHVKFARLNFSLPVLSSAVIVPTSWSPNGFLLVGVNESSNPGLNLFTLGEYGGYSEVPIPLGVNESLGSSIFTSIGDTRLTTSGLTPGMIAVASQGGELFVAMTTNVEGRTSLATMVSMNGGANWSGPYLSGATEGTILDPAIDMSIAGYVFVSWLEGSASEWQVELAVYSPSGSLLRAAEPLPGGSNVAQASNSAPTLFVDSFMRPIVAWTAPGSNGSTVIDYSGAFVSPRAEVAALSAGFNATAPADFENFGQPGLSQFQQRVNGLFADLEVNLSTAGLCGMLHDSLWLYTNLTWIDPWALLPGPQPAGCTVSQGLNNTILADTWGTMDANVYLSVESSTLLESVGLGTMPDPPWTMIGWPTSAPAPFQPGQKGTYTDHFGDVVSTFPWTVTPDSMWLWTQSSFPGKSGTIENSYHGLDCGSSYLKDNATLYQEQISINGGPPSPFYSSTTGVPSVYVSNLTAMQTGSWSEQVTVTFQTTNQSTNTCPASYGFKNGTFNSPPPSGWPATMMFTVSGTFTTGLDPYPAMMTMNSTSDSPSSGPMNDTLNWTNTLDADANIWLNATSCPLGVCVHWNNSSYQLSESAHGQGLQAVNPSTYQMMFQIQSTKGLGNWSWSPIFNAAQVSVAAPVETVQVSCSFQQLSNPAQSWYDKNTVAANVTGSSALITWYSQSQGLGWVTYNTTDGGVSTQTAQSVVLPNGSAEYFAQLHGLEPWAIYQAMGHVEIQTACTSPGQPVGIQVDYPGNTTAFNFQTLAQVPLEEQDYPYDSITKQGGGSLVFWRVPLDFRTISTFDNGSLSYYPKGHPSNTTVLPLQPPLPEVYSIPNGATSTKVVNTTYGLNVTGLVGNTTYTVNLSMNYTLKATGQTFVVTGEPFNFTYEKDTSGDGLTDWEKAYGWTVTYDPILGWLYGWNSEHVSANPKLFATNGLVGDYVEKEYGLDPHTVDTSSSHMLDTWNLTFNLEPGNGKLPQQSNFETWNAGSSYDPFGTTVQYTPGHYESGRPIAQNISNISADSTGGITSGDGAPWAAEALWSYSALEKFENLSGVKGAGWLRAIEGSWDGIPTLTVEGKLSWGANPLAASTPNDNLPDGQRVNPLTEVGVEFGPVYANISGQPSGTGFAVKMSYSTCEPGYGCSSVRNYSTNATVGAPSPWPSWVDGYSVLLPVSQAYSDTIMLQVVANESGGNLVPLALNGSQTAINVTCNAVLGTCSPIDVSGNSANLHGTMRFVPVGAKAPTWLWVPTDNSTVNGLPVGLERYTGEQSFDLVVANVSSSVSSDQIPLPWGGTGSSITLSSGLNDFLVPRAQLQYSPLGQAIFLGLNTSYDTSAGAPPLVGSAEQSLISGFGGSNYMVELGAYWQNRAIASGPGNITGSTESGTPLQVSGQQNPLVVQVTAVKGAGSGADAGGLPSTPALYNASDTPAAVQSIITLNVTSTATLDLLLAGLMDNVTGGINGTVQSITYQVPFMGFDRIVANAIANASQASDGLYGSPGSHFPPPPPGLWDRFWNAVSSAIQSAAGAILSLATIVWNAAEAALTYLNRIGAEAAKIGGEVWARAASTLVSVGKAILTAFNELLSELAKEASQLISSVLQPILEQFQNYAGAIVSDLSTIENANGNPSQASLRAFWNDAGGSVFVALFVMAAVIGTAVTIVSLLDPAAGFLADIILQIVITIAVTAASVLALSFFQGLSSWGTDAIFAIESVFNSSGGMAPQMGPLGPNSCSWQPAWDSFAEIFGIIADVVSGLTLGPVLLAGAVFAPEGKFTKNDITGRFVDLAAGLLAIGLDVIGASDQSNGDYGGALFLSIWGTLLGGGAMLMDAVLEGTDFDYPLNILDGIGDLLDGSSVAIGSATIIADKGVC